MNENSDPTNYKNIESGSESKTPKPRSYIRSIDAVVDPLKQHIIIVRYCMRPAKLAGSIAKGNVTSASAAKFLLFCFTLTGLVGYFSGQINPVAQNLNQKFGTSVFNVLNIPVLGSFFVFLLYVPVQGLVSKILYFIVLEKQDRGEDGLFVVMLISSGLFLVISYISAVVLALAPTYLNLYLMGYGLFAFSVFYPIFSIAKVYDVPRRRVAGAYSLLIGSVLIVAFTAIFIRLMWYSDLINKKIYSVSPLEIKREEDQTSLDLSSNKVDRNLSPSNVYLWGAALDTLSFMQLRFADVTSGLIVTNWYEPDGVAGERFRASAMVLSPTLEPKALNVVINRQVRQNGQWRDASISSTTEEEIVNKMLGRARELKANGELSSLLAKPIRYDYLPHLQMPTSAIDVVNYWSPPPRPGATHIESLLPIQPSSFFQQLLRDRLFAAGPTGRAICQIEEASIIQFADHIEGKLAVNIYIGGSSTLKEQQIQVHVERSIKSINHVSTAVMLEASEMLGELLEDMNVELEFQISRVTSRPAADH